MSSFQNHLKNIPKNIKGPARKCSMFLLKMYGVLGEKVGDFWGSGRMLFVCIIFFVYRSNIRIFVIDGTVVIIIYHKVPERKKYFISKFSFKILYQ